MQELVLLLLLFLVGGRGWAPSNGFSFKKSGLPEILKMNRIFSAQPGLNFNIEFYEMRLDCIFRRDGGRSFPNCTGWDMNWNSILPPGDLSSLKDTREKESAAFIGREPCSAERSHVRSLRASFIQVLEDRRYAGNDLIIFGESDAVPMVASSRLEAALRKEMEEHPETDIFRLFHHAVWSPQGNPFESDELFV